MNWRVKAGLQAAFSYVPAGHELNYLFRRYITRTVPATPFVQALDYSFAAQHAANFRAHGPLPIEEAQFYEFGAGWDLTIPLSYYALGVNRQIIVDLRPLLKPALIAQTTAALPRLKLDPPPRRLPRLFPAGASGSKFCRLLREYYGIDYRAPFDARATGFETGSVDYISTSKVLSYIPVYTLQEILRECLRILRPGGVMSVLMDHRDNYSYFDKNISVYNFLQFSDEVWERFYSPPLNYQNRLRHCDYRQLFSEAGFEIVRDEPGYGGPIEAARALLATVPLAERFKRYTADELAAVRGFFVVRKQLAAGRRDDASGSRDIQDQSEKPSAPSAALANGRAQRADGHHLRAVRALRRPADSLIDLAANVWSLRRLAGWIASSPQRGPTVAQRLGYDSRARLLVINADDFGLCHEQNLATIRGLDAGTLSSASLMVPCAGFEEAGAYARRHPQTDLGIHLTLTSEWPLQRWGPILGRDKVRSLTNGDGCFWRNSAELFAHCRPEEAEAELRAQIERALATGVDVTHLDSHMFTLHGKHAELRRIYLRLAQDYSLPIRAARRTLAHWYGFHSVPDQADALGILHPDHFAVLSRVRPANAPDFWSALLQNLPPGLTEICCHPGYASGELASFAEDATQREADVRFFVDGRAREILQAEGIRVVGYRLLRNAMRERADNLRQGASA